jgi:hypothetical protein
MMGPVREGWRYGDSYLLSGVSATAAAIHSAVSLVLGRRWHTVDSVILVRGLRSLTFR